MDGISFCDFLEADTANRSYKLDLRKCRVHLILSLTAHDLHTFNSSFRYHQTPTAAAATSRERGTHRLQHHPAEAA